MLLQLLLVDIFYSWWSSKVNMNNVSFTAVQSIFFLLFLLSVWLIVYKIVKAEEESVNYNGGEGWNKSICFQDYTTDEWNQNWIPTIY